MLEIIPTRREVWFCPACGDTDRVETTYWVRANARELLDEDGSPLGHDWCPACECHVRLDYYEVAGAGPFCRVVGVP